MKITKFVHACLLVEMPAPVNRTVLFDPGAMSEAALNIDTLAHLDDLVITHIHPDHYNPELIKKLVSKFPEVRITAPAEVVEQLSQEGITASDESPQGMTLFDSPHENVEPLFPHPEQIGVHYLETLTHPGDSHSFTETKDILALPVAGPWASTIVGLNLAIKLKPRYVLPIHDWHWSDQAREQMYELLGQAFDKEGITFMPLKTGEPIVIDTEGVV
ncbi:MAG: hypothetical protein JWN82_501 [Candidatus Saccharibacteria bacterium]|nr:hypothetical protein [Candidatus Saccharibacteria bacterium]